MVPGNAQEKQDLGEARRKTPVFGMKVYDVIDLWLDMPLVEVVSGLQSSCHVTCVAQSNSQLAGSKLSCSPQEGRQQPLLPFKV